MCFCTIAAITDKALFKIHNGLAFKIIDFISKWWHWTSFIIVTYGQAKPLFMSEKLYFAIG